jgi:hypothetical protein
MSKWVASPRAPQYVPQRLPNLLGQSLILAISGFGSYEHCETITSTHDYSRLPTPHHARQCPECGHGPRPSRHFRAATKPAAVLELLQRLHQVLRKTRHAQGGVRRDADAGEAGDVPESASGELGSSSRQGTSGDSFSPECHLSVFGVYLYSLSCARIDGFFFFKRPMSGPITWASEARSS